MPPMSSAQLNDTRNLTFLLARHLAFMKGVGWSLETLSHAPLPFSNTGVVFNLCKGWHPSCVSVIITEIHSMRWRLYGNVAATASWARVNFDGLLCGGRETVNKYEWVGQGGVRGLRDSLGSSPSMLCVGCLGRVSSSTQYVSMYHL